MEAVVMEAVVMEEVRRLRFAILHTLTSYFSKVDEAVSE